MFIGGERLVDASLAQYDEAGGIAKWVSFVRPVGHQGDSLRMNSLVHPNDLDRVVPEHVEAEFYYLRSANAANFGEGGVFGQDVVGSSVS
jgi:hypothetical protein